jgi:hypothetical protein
MASVFVKADPLLRSVGMVVLFFHLFRVASRDGWDGDIERDALAKFEKRRVKNRELAEKDLGAADYELLEFDRFTQTPNDAYATKYRLEVLCKKAFQRELPESERQKEKASMPEYAKPADVDTAP